MSIRNHKAPKMLERKAKKEDKETMIHRWTITQNSNETLTRFIRIDIQSFELDGSRIGVSSGPRASATKKSEDAFYENKTPEKEWKS
ncbi:hypothetical protein EAI_08939 [Harpegnathos saltator]|uniref:Uncharacterized protein n=1 Tax=Harpegnathos saltator TaxID=610380 RepID=E2BYI5_HARSA|nr:hypothetical protein EAI_08939 [Harpegnathos saltator]